MHLQVPNEPSLRNEMKRRFQSQKWDNTTLSTGRKRWSRENPRKLSIWWYWYMYYNGSQYKDIYIYIYIFIYLFIYLYMKYLMIRYWWVTGYEFVVRIIYLKGLFPHPMLVYSTYWVISPPFISPYKYIRWIIGVEIIGRQQLQIILWNWGFYYYFYGIKHCIGELFWGCYFSLVD